MVKCYFCDKEAEYHWVARLSRLADDKVSVNEAEYLCREHTEELTPDWLEHNDSEDGID